MARVYDNRTSDAKGAFKPGSTLKITGKGGKVILRYTKARGGGLTIKVPPKAEASPAELLKAIEGLLS